MHEEDAGLLWKHVEYRNGHSEVRRSRRLVLSFVSTVVSPRASESLSITHSLPRGWMAASGRPPSRAIPSWRATFKA